MDRRAELAEQALGYVLEHGVAGLSLRPLAAALGTSDRMLIYHFGSKEQLVKDVLALAQQRLAASMESPGTDIQNVGDLIRHLWAAVRSPGTAQVTRLYLDVCVLATQEPERWRGAPEQLRGPWKEPTRAGLVALGVAPERAPALADLVLDTFDGLAIDRLVTTDPARVDAAAAEFAELMVKAVTGQP
jgi:AcrR family transcriptional regulator